jgi:hypothetical protein
VFDTLTGVDRHRELEFLRRSIAMLSPRAILDREKAMRLIRQLEDAEERLRHLRNGLARLLEEAGPIPPAGG